MVDCTGASPAISTKAGPQAAQRRREPLHRRRDHVRAAQLDQAGEGQRNHTLNRAAFSIAQFVATGAVPSDWVREQLEARAVAIGLPAVEARRTIASAFAAGMAQPRRIPG